MTWQRRARIAVAAVGLSCAAAVYFLSRDRQPPIAAPVTTATDRDANAQSGAGTIVHFKDGKKELELKYERAWNYPDGRSRFEKVHVVFEKDGQQIFADVVETKGTAVNGDGPANYDLSGNVRLVGKDNVTVTTGTATYDNATGILSMPGEVTFTRGRLSGRGVGATYSRDQQFLQLLDQASLTVAPDAESADTVEATARTMSFARAQKSLRLEQNAKIVRPTETLEADTAAFGLTDDEQSIRFLELRGHARVTPTSAAGAPPGMDAHDITLGFQPDGRTLEHATLTGEARVSLASEQGPRSISASWIDLFVMPDGRTLKGIQARDQVVVTLPATKELPARTIKAATLDAQGDDKRGLQLARFDKDVTFEEWATAGRGQTPPAPRTATSRTLILKLGGQIDAIEEAEFRQRVVFLDGDVRGDAELATYDARGKGALRLRRSDAAPDRLPNVTDGSFTAKAHAIDVSLDTHDLYAKGAVRTVTNPSKKKTADAKAPGLFNQDEAIRGAASELIYTNATGKAVYTGTGKDQAEVRQPPNFITGDRIAFDDSTRNLDAKGNVVSEFRLDRQSAEGPDAKKPSRYHVTAQSLVYDEAARTATYRDAVTMKGDDGVTEGDTITLHLAKEGRSIESLEVDGVDGKVFAQLSGGYEVRGDRLEYDAAKDVYHVVGKPVKVKSPAKDGSGCVISRGPEVVLNRKANTVLWPPGRGGAQGRDEIVKCDVSIRGASDGR